MAGNITVQIYTVQSADEAVAVAGSGVDHVGVTPSDRGLPGEVTPRIAREVCAALVGVATSVALTVETDLDAIADVAREVWPDILHLCGPQGAVGPADVAQLRRLVPDVEVMQAIAVTGPEAIDLARSYESVADYLLLDSLDPDIPGVGAAGATHDWAISRAIVEAVDVPVVLAGGLSVANVAEAIAAVRPWGVDSLTHTNRPIGGGRFRKDLDLVRAFAVVAREAAS
jgi:phosphoribosylanthranilate isomerase